MHVCLVGFEYPNATGFGGIATYQKIVANELIKMGHKVTVICGSLTKEEQYYEDCIHVIRLCNDRKNETLESFNNYKLKVKETILKINAKEKIDIIETPEFSGEILEFLKNNKIPVVVKLHTSYKIWSNLNNQKLYRNLHNQVIKSENLSMLYADKLICCSEVLKQLMPKYHPKIDLNKIEVVGNPADIINFYPLKDNHKSKTILYCGSVEKRKGIFKLAKAIPLIVDNINDKQLKFQIIGNYNTDVKTAFLNEIPKKYHKQIEFLGYIDNIKLNKYYNEARIGVIPSLFDNLPYVAMEELLTELPIVASENTGIREMIKNNESGILYNPNDHKALANGVIKLYKNPKLASKYGKKAREEILNKYSPSVIAKKNIQIYGQAIRKFEKNILHVCLVNYEYPEETSIGGISTYQKRIADALINQNCKVTVICGALNKNQDYYDSKIHVIRIKKKFPYESKKDYYDYRRYLNDKIKEINEFDKIDVIESPEIVAELVTFFKNKNIPVVTKLHTSYTIIKAINENYAMFNDGLEKIIAKNENIVINKSDKLICCSEVLKQLMPKYHPKIDLNKIEVVGNPADVINFYPLKDNHKSKTILYCGNFTKRKGIFQLAKAIPLIIDSINDNQLKFQIIGKFDGAEQRGVSFKDVFLNEIPKKYHKQIEFLGYIDNIKLNKYYNEARIGVIPSLFDNLPYVAMEELLTELPIVASENTGIREMIKNNESGILYNPNDYKSLANGVIKLYKNPKLASKYGKKAREEILNKYSPSVIAKKNIQIYGQAIRKFNDDNIIKQICKKYNISNLKKMKYGNANKVYECTYKNKKCVLKIYDKEKNYNFDLINYIHNKFENTEKIIICDEINDYKIYLLSYINGIHKKNYSDDDLKKIINNIKKIEEVGVLKTNDTNIFDKYKMYRDYFVENSIKLSDKFVINKLLSFDKKISNILSDTLFDKIYIVHGDLSKHNILWCNNEVKFVDFDECILAPTEYEYISFLIKSCFYNNFFDIDIAKRIVNILKQQNINLQKLKKIYYFYILKVIFEKFYYSFKYNLDLESQNQKKDYWKWWFNLLNNNTLSKMLFDEHQKNIILLKIIKDDYKSKVIIVKENNKKYVLKLDNSLYNNAIEEQKILLNLKNFINVTVMVDIIYYNNLIYKKYEYYDGISLEKTNNFIEQEKLFEEVLKLHRRLEEISNYINCEQGSIIDKLSEYKKNITDNLIIGVLTKLQNDKIFLKKIEEEKKVIIHDDLNPSNILYGKNGICFIDYTGLKKYPKSMQLASFITLYYFCDNKNVDIQKLIDLWDKTLNMKYLEKLIVFRLIKVYNYLNTKNLSRQELRLKKIVYEQIKMMSKG